MRKRYVVWGVLIAVSAGMSLHTSQLTRTEERKLDAINKEIAAEETRTRVLEAEWTMLSTPSRLEALSSRYLQDLAPSGAVKEVAQLASVPDRLVMPDAALSDAPVAVASAAPQPASPISQPVAAAPVEASESDTASAPIKLASATTRALPKAQPAEEVGDDEASDDPIRVLIEEQHTPPRGVLWARVDGLTVGGTGGANR